ncbi:MAG: hypothetical protein VW620_10655 [Rhodospirillales bacterium]|jgi:hypothetical protein
MVDFDADADVRRAGWIHFTKMTTVATIGVAGLLILMAVFLL